MRHSGLTHALLVLTLVPSGLQAQVDSSLDELDETRTAIGVGIIHQAAYDQLYTVGTLGTLPADSTATFRAPLLAQVLVAMSARALAASGQIDLDEPIGLVLPDVDPSVGRVTLNQLLHHASGLDDAEFFEGQTWDQALAALDEGAFVLPPGEVVSYSRYSFPLAARTLEQLADAPIADIADALILAPLGLTDTRIGGRATVPTLRRHGENREVIAAELPDSTLGLPVTVTSLPDLLTLSATWMNGGIPGSTPTPAPLLPKTRRAIEMRDGLMMIAEDAAAMLATEGLRWMLVPATGTASVRWTTGTNASRTDLRVSMRVRELSGVPVVGGSRRPPPPAESSAADRPAADDAWPIEPWVGSYRNGSVKFELRNIDGQLHVFDGRQEQPMRHAGDGVLELDRDDVSGADIRVATIAGERVAFYLNLVYRLEGPPTG